MTLDGRFSVVFSKYEARMEWFVWERVRIRGIMCSQGCGTDMSVISVGKEKREERGREFERIRLEAKENFKEKGGGIGVLLKFCSDAFV